MTIHPPRTKYKTGVSLEPEVVRSLDQLAVLVGLDRSSVLNTIVRDYLRFAQQHQHVSLAPPAAKETIIRIS
jgi:hypothetical protein